MEVGCFILGIYRIILSIIVFLYHFKPLNGPSPVSGISAVLGFYLISGYLMILVMDKVYSKYDFGALLFYLNRFLRIVPLYLFYFIATLLLIYHHQTNEFQLNYGEIIKQVVLDPIILKYSNQDIFHDVLFEFFRYYHEPNSLAFILNGFPDVVPTAWSLNSEIIFYLSVPLLVLFIKNKNDGQKQFKTNLLIGFFFLCVLYSLYTSMQGLEYVGYRFKSVFGCYFVFLLGMLIYVFKEKLPKFSFPFTSFFVTLIVILCSMYGINYSKPLVESHVYFILIFQILILIIGSQLPKGNNLYRAFDDMCGKLCYGVFLGQFFSFALFSNILEKISFKNNIILTIGAPSSVSFTIYSLIFTIFIAFITYFAIEYPIERIRKSIREKGVSGIKKNNVHGPVKPL